MDLSSGTDVQIQLTAPTADVEETTSRRLQEGEDENTEQDVNDERIMKLVLTPTAIP